MPKAKGKKTKDLDPKGRGKKVKGGRTHVRRDVGRVNDIKNDVVGAAQTPGRRAGDIVRRVTE